MSFPDLPDEVEQTLVSPRRSEAERVVERLQTLGWTIAVGESLTGGLLVSALVDVPGASAVVRGGVVAYATPAKHTLLGVDAALLTASGPIDAEVARQLAEGARTVFTIDGRRADVGVATTGVAGPDSQDGRPVGTVYISASTPLGVRTEELLLTGGRDAIRAETVRRALRLVLAVL